MKQFLIKLLEISRSVLGVLVGIARGLITFLRSVNIDQPRGVLLCVTLQLVLVIALILAFRDPASGIPAMALEGQSPPLTASEVTKASLRELPRTPLAPSEHQ